MAPYPALDRLLDQAQAAAKAVGAKVQVYGHSVQGRPLMAFFVPCLGEVTPETKTVLLGANLHGIEVIGAYVALGLLQAMSQAPDPWVQKLRARANLWVIPSYNPDGYQKTMESDGHGPLSLLRTNARGVDLNRNFPRPCKHAPYTLGFAGSRHPGKATYKGPHPLSEPESRCLFEWLEQTPIHAALNLHSFSGGLIPARVRGAHDFRHYRALHRAYLAPRPRPYFFRLHSRWIDAWTGELEDTQHHLLGTWASCVELLTIKESFAQRADRNFWRFNPKDPQAHLIRELPRIASALLQACDFPSPREGISRHEVWDLRQRHALT